MTFRTIQDHGLTLDEMTSGGLRVLISRKGAEMVSLALNGTGFLYRDGEYLPPDSGWANHATVMGYFIHRLWNEQSVYRGKPIFGGTHGFLRHFDFDEPKRLDDGLVYRVAADRVQDYPLRVSCELSYRIVDGAVRVDFAFRNEEPDLAAHVSFGLHPGFAVSSLANAKIILPAGRYTRHLAPGNFLDGRSEVLEFAGGEFPYPKAGLPDSFLLDLEGVPDRIFVLQDNGRSLVLDFSEAPQVTFWSNSDKFLCIEPCWGLPDSNPPTAFENKEGIQTLPPGGQLRRGFSIRPNL